ncbi:energy transducer TonB [Limnobacter sp.]|uniref:energy transducer TonB n=1 Tax=Limnobacter sp. TaxID=2003368 RepID=UPI0027333C0D|nr:energy transducer TonB [Limnobacter sp.]MDP3187696.1 energy transducer TonB [Limnobacter sp.]
MNADIAKPRNGWEFTPAHQALLSKMTKESGLESRLPPPEDHTGEKVGLTASLLAHLALVAFFMVGLNWNTEEPAAFEAVLWSEMPANEPVAAPQPEPKPETEQKPEPEPKVEPPPPPPKPVEPPKAEIELPKPKPEPKKPEPKPEPKKPEPKPEPKPKPKPEPKPEPKKPEPQPEPKPEPRIDPELAKKLRQEELARITGGAPNTGSTSAGNSRNKALYSDRIRQYVRSKIVFPSADSVDGNPEAVFEVKQLPNGEIVSITQKKSSGLPAWDSAVERALQRSSPLPRAEDGSVEPVLVLSFRPKDV